jgi:transposase
MWPRLGPRKAALRFTIIVSDVETRSGHFGNLRKPRRQRLGLYYQLCFDNIGQEEVCMFLRELLRHSRGQVIVVLDNSCTHQGILLQQLLRLRSRLHIEHVPSYAPELNPDEGVWSLAKRALANSCPNDGGVGRRRHRLDQRYSYVNSETTRLHTAIRIALFFALVHCIIYAEFK